MQQPQPMQPPQQWLPPQQWPPPAQQPVMGTVLGQAPVAQADGMAIASLILAFFVPIAGAILGMVSRGQAKSKGLQPSPVATWGMILGWVFTGIAVLSTILVVILAASNTTTY